jgi:hypothetical protein
MLDSAIWKNEKFGVMPPMARLLAIGIINQADDQGRGKAHPVYLRSQVFPYDDVTAGDVAGWLAMVATNETILLYQVEGKDYYQIINWWSYQSHQYAMPSQYPKPDGWKDRIRKVYTKGLIVTCNWITVNGDHSPDTCDEQGMIVKVNDKVNDNLDGSGEDINLSLSLSSSLGLSSSLSSSLSSTSKSKPNGKAEDTLIDPELAQALAQWKETFTGTPYEANPPIAQLPKWLAYAGVEVMCYMIGKAKDKSNPGGYLFTTFDNWRKDGEVAPYIVKAARDAAIASSPVVMTKKQVTWADGMTEEREVATHGL